MKKVLIANRGEIAVRVARACADAGLLSVAVYADPDADSLHVRRADEAYALGGSSPAETYLDMGKIIAIARRSGADAVHPGYGFLSENADFAQAVLDDGLTWIGPTPEAIRLLGNKVTAREVAVRAGAPLVPGSDGPVANAAQARAFAERARPPDRHQGGLWWRRRGLKMAPGPWTTSRTPSIGRARGHRGLRPRGVLRGTLSSASRATSRRRSWPTRTATSWWSAPGTARCSGATRSSWRRRRAPFLTPAQRERIYASAKAICREAGYHGAGTVEYLLAADGTISFLEVNTRLQVEHPVTEETTGVDLVAGAVPDRRRRVPPSRRTRNPAAIRSSSGSTPRIRPAVPAGPRHDHRLRGTHRAGPAHRFRRAHRLRPFPASTIPWWPSSSSRAPIAPRRCAGPGPRSMKW